MNFFAKLFCPFHKKCREKNITPPVYLDTIEDKGEAFLVRLKGALDMATLGTNREKMTAVIEAMHLYSKNIILDLQKVTHTDSATVAALLGRFLDIKEKKKRIALINIPEALRDLIEVLKVEHNFLIYKDTQSALKGVRELDLRNA